MSARGTIHEIWESFFPPVLFAAAYVAASAYVAGQIPPSLSREGLSIRAQQIGDIGFVAELKELELLSLLPVVFLFMAGFALYLFDRLVSALAALLPPQHFWSGITFLYHEKRDLWDPWSLMPHVDTIHHLAREVERQVERAYAEGRTRFTESLEWPQKKFSAAAHLAAHCKIFMYWVFACAAASVFGASPPPGLFGRMSLLLLLAFVAFALSLLSETHWLFEIQERRLRIAAQMCEQDGVERDFSQERNQLFESQLKEARNHAPRPMLRFSWGSAESAKRLYAAMRPSRRVIPASFSRREV